MIDVKTYSDANDNGDTELAEDFVQAPPFFETCFRLVRVAFQHGYEDVREWLVKARATK